MSFNPNYTAIKANLGSYFGYSLIVVSLCPYFYETLLNENNIQNKIIGSFLIFVILISWLILLIQLIFYNIHLKQINDSEPDKNIVLQENFMNCLISSAFSFYLFFVFILIVYLIIQLFFKIIVKQKEL